MTTNVISGAEVFRLMDEEGMPLDLISDSLRREGMAFNADEFVRAAADHDYPMDTLRERMAEAYRGEEPERFRTLVTHLIARCYRERWP